jgi:hypothetical protein
MLSCPASGGAVALTEKNVTQIQGLSAVKAPRVGALALIVALAPAAAGAQPAPPALTAPVNDFANVIDGASAAELDRLIRVLQAATGDVVAVATVRSAAEWGDIRAYATKMFENHGKGIGQQGRDNGLLVLVAVDDREVWIEVGYDLEGFVTDGFAGETSRQYMAPHFRDGAVRAGAGGRRDARRAARRRGPAGHARGRGRACQDTDAGTRRAARGRTALRGHPDPERARRPRRAARPQTPRLAERRRTARRRVRGGQHDRPALRLRRGVRRRVRRLRRGPQRRRGRRGQMVMC